MRTRCSPAGCTVPLTRPSARYETYFLYTQRRPSWRRQTCPRTSRPVMLRLGMMTRLRCQVVGLAVRGSNPSLEMLIFLNLIDAMLTHPANRRAAGITCSAPLGAPIRLYGNRPKAATARNNLDPRDPLLDPRDTGIIANREATVVDEIRSLG